MTTPTQAQIEAALRDLVERLDFVHNNPAYKSVWAVNQLHVGPYSGPTYEKELEKAKAALTAAAEAGRTGQEASDNATSSLDWTAAAEEAGTIERCAKVAEKLYGPQSEIAAAIRALKEKP